MSNLANMLVARMNGLGNEILSSICAAAALPSAPLRRARSRATEEARIRPADGPARAALAGRRGFREDLQRRRLRGRGLRQRNPLRRLDADARATRGPKSPSRRRRAALVCRRTRRMALFGRDGRAAARLARHSAGAGRGRHARDRSFLSVRRMRRSCESPPSSIWAIRTRSSSSTISAPMISPRLARRSNTHPIFPERANISLARVVARDHIELKVWERGVGLTLRLRLGRLRRPRRRARARGLTRP